MKQARSRTRGERDIYALNRIEYLLDQAIEGKGIKKWSNQRLRAMEIRYSRLRATLQAVEIEDRREGWSEFLRRLNARNGAPVAELPGDANDISDAQIVSDTANAAAQLVQSNDTDDTNTSS